ncbi:GNAT family N-acetyltransferase [Streptomyces coeruleoprunus]|uniref:GNAT family N-acetyltransferase n=1 Tax=Streptomyces coeruleoprunus TaxID=285563 RepID=A0ABV9XAX3_9ACTN
MITATPRPATLLPSAPHPLLPPPAPTFSVRSAGPRDAAALAALSQPFVRSGALRARPFHVYAWHAADFLVAEGPDGALEGCLALRVQPEPTSEGRATGVLYNFCVARHRQGSGLGARLLGAALAQGRSQSLDALFTATTGSGRLFLRYGFTPVPQRLAPEAWARTLDPRRNAKVLARVL